MKAFRVLLLSSVLVFSQAALAGAATGARSGLPEGLNMGLGASGLSLDWAGGPLAFGGAITGDMFSANALSPTLRLVWTARNRDNLSVGFLAGAHYGLSTPIYNPIDQTTSPFGRELVGDVGLTASYRFDLPLLFERVLPLTLTPTLTFKIDRNGSLAFGPQTNIELAARFSKDVELTLGGGTIVGLRFQI